MNDSSRSDDQLSVVALSDLSVAVAEENCRRKIGRVVVVLAQAHARRSGKQFGIQTLGNV